jgi:hypothetical protein
MNKLVALFEKFGIIRAKRDGNGFIKFSGYTKY